jgi:hypothetical protein
MKKLLTAVLLVVAVPLGDAVPVREFPNKEMRDVFTKIESLVNDHFDYRFSDDVPDVALSLPNKRIGVNITIWTSCDGTQRFFWLLHEMGHHKLGHLSDAGQVLGFTQPWLRPSMELKADSYAIKKMLESGLKAGALRAEMRALFRSNPGDSTHPSGAVRVQNIERALSADATPDEGDGKEVDRDARIQQCLQEKQKRCMVSCQEAWGYSRQKCATEMCTLNPVNLDVWLPACQKQVDRDIRSEKRSRSDDQ